LVNEREREVIATAIRLLPEKERLVLTLYYYEELTMKEIGELMKVTESRVCQVHTKAIIRLKAHLQATS
jgi:RNA polymerase sigma factor for flagellar operon FliA